MFHLVPASVVKELLNYKNSENQNKFRTLLLWAYQFYPVQLGTRCMYEFLFFDYFTGVRYGTYHEVMRSLVRDYTDLTEHVYLTSDIDVAYGNFDLVKWFTDRAFEYEGGETCFREIVASQPLQDEDSVAVLPETFLSITDFAAENFIPWVTSVAGEHVSKTYIEQLDTCAKREQHIKHCDFCRHEWLATATENPHPMCALLRTTT